MTSKICTKCKTPKEFSEFGKRSSTTDGLSCSCKECERKRGMEKYFKSPEKYAERAKKWRNSHKEQMNAIARKSHKKSRLECRELKDKIAAANPCIVCQDNRIHCLDFHHLDPSIKKDPVAACTSIKTLLEEAAKCIVLCCKCHRLYHAGDIILPPNPTPVDVTPYKRELD